ncbi:hydroxymethylglutaryl-CoA lyase [Aurantibacillus circumpalustris]|uniref:hydroxymethylglutaryl-CoA lyase n=1 Tax=Aurantibacillus circumpalustris TaxID=3036359 RepID=UPI00295AA958|nr:hydroxymethylglutaryl-CoA lyase [Aurantibacillus circumpalustris]
MINITECPRDAMQGIKQQIPSELKVEYINQLLKVGFKTIDFGSFVSPKAIPQMQDTAKVLDLLDLSAGNTDLLAIIANLRGAQEACAFEEISYLGFPFSISETFQQRNTNSSIEESLARVEEIQRLCLKKKKKLLVYISMAFGNPYGDAWHADIAIDWCKRLNALGIKHLALADTTGSSTPETISQLFGALLPELKNVELGAHLHSTKDKSQEKLKAAYESGCRNFDVAIHGFGGCPMAADDLTGNIATEDLESYAITNKINLNLNKTELDKAYELGWKIFNVYH